MESMDTGSVDSSLEGAASAAEQDSQGIESELLEGQKKPTPEQKALAKFKVKVDGQEMEVDENELKRSYAHAKAAAKRLAATGPPHRAQGSWMGTIVLSMEYSFVW
jgi:hypothetical protein